VVCVFNILHYGSVVWKTALSVRFGFGFREPESWFRFGSVLFFVLFCFQLSASATQRTMNVFLCFNALQQWLSACVTLLMLIHSLNYTFYRVTRHSHDDEINCSCVWQWFINIYCLSTAPKNTHFACECPFLMLWILTDCFLNEAHRIDIISHKLTFNTDINI